MPVKLVLAEAGNGHPGFSFSNLSGVSPRATRPFCFGKRTQNHFRPCTDPRVSFATVSNHMAAELAPGVVQKGPLACAKPKFFFGEARSSKAAGSEKSEAYGEVL